MGRAARFENGGHAGATEETEDPRDRDEPQLAEHETAEQKGVYLHPVSGDERLKYFGQILCRLERSRHGHLRQRALRQFGEQVVGEGELAHRMQCKKGDDMPQTWFTGFGIVGSCWAVVIFCGENVLDFRRQAEPTTPLSTIVVTGLL